MSYAQRIKLITALSKIVGRMYHGRYGSQNLSNNTVILWSHDLSVAEAYAGKNGSIWQLTDASVLVDAEIVIDRVQKFLKRIEKKYGRDSTPEWFRDVAYSDLGLINPENIVDSAGWWDNTEFVNWFCEEFQDIVGVLTEDGCVTLSPNAGSPKKISPIK